MVVEFRLGLRFGDVRPIRTNIQLRLGILLITVLHSTRKGHQHLHIVVLLLLYVAFDLVVVAHCRKAGGGNNHHFTPAADLVSGGFPEGLHDDLCLLGDVIRMQLLIFADHLSCTAGGHIRVIFGGFDDFEAGVIGHIVLEYIQNKAFLNGLPHTVNVERMKAAVLIFRAEQFQRLVLGRCGKGKEG